VGDYSTLLAQFGGGTESAPPRLLTFAAPSPGTRAHKRKRKSLFRQVAGMPGEAFDLLRAAPVGLVHLGWESVKGAATGMPRLLGATIADVRRGDFGKAAARIGDVSTAGVFTKGPRSYGFEGGYGLGMVPVMLVSSAAATGHRLTNPTEYLRALEEGRLLGVLAEDIGNLSIVGGAAAKALGAGARAAATAGNAARAQQLARASVATSRAARLGGRLADTPINAPVHLGGSAIRAGGRAARGAGERLLLKTEAGRGFARRHPFAVREDARAARRASVAERQSGNAAIGQTVTVLRRALPEEVVVGRRDVLGGRTTRDYTQAELDEFAAAQLLHSGELGAFKTVGDVLGVAPEVISELGQRYNLPGHTITPEAVRLANDFEAGTLAPDVAARIERMRSAIADAVDIGTVREVAGTGTLPLTLDNQRQTPIPTVEAARAKFAPDMPATPGLTRRQVFNYARENTPGFTLKEWQAWHTYDQPTNPALYPAQHRTTMGMLRRASAAIAAEDAPTLSAANKERIARHRAEGVEIRRAERDLDRTDREIARLERKLDSLDARIAGRAAQEAQEALPALQSKRADVAELVDQLTWRLEQDRLSRESSKESIAWRKELLNDAKAELAAINKEIAKHERTIARRDPTLTSTASTALVDRRSRTVDRLLELSENYRDFADSVAARRAAFESAGPPVLDEGRAALISTRPWDYTRQGEVRTGFVPAGRFDAPESASVDRKVVGGQESTTGKFKRGPENFRTGEGVIPRTPEGMAGLLTQNIESSTRNAMFDAAGRAAGNTPSTLVDPATLGVWRAEAEAQAQATVGAGATPTEALSDVNRETTRIYGARLIKEMKKRGYEPWPERGDVLAKIDESLVNDATVFVPDGLRNAIGPYIETPEPRGPLGVINAVNSQWKGWVLPFSARWQIGDGVSNFLMAGLAGGLSPAEYLRWISVSRRLRGTADGARLLELVQNQSGLTREAGQWIYGKGNLGTVTPSQSRFAPVRVLQKARDAGWRVNEVQNRAARSAVTLAKLDAELRRVNLGGIEGVGVERLARIQPETHPDLWNHVRAAIDEANTVLGDMTNLPPWQRKWMRSIMPFWPWMRHVAQLSARLAIDDPIRLVFVMRLGDLVGTDDELPEYLQGHVRGPGGWWPTQFVNPFADVGGMPGNPFGSNPTKAITAPMSPAIKWAAAAGGLDFDEGFEPLSMPFGSGWRDETGALIPTPLLFANPLGMAYRVAKSYPLLRQGLDLLPEGEIGGGVLGRVATGPVLRYDTGVALRDRRGNMIRKDTSRAPILVRIGQVASLPTPVSDEVMEQARKRTRRRRKRPVGLLNT
jgi:hypothetical protein